MRERILIVVGCQKEKLDQINKRKRGAIIDFINAHSVEYNAVVSIIRKPCNGDRNFQASGNTMSSTNTYLDYESTNIIEVPGYDVDCSMFRADVHYDVIGISTSSSVLCVAMSMYSRGLDVNVLAPYCEDRKSKHLEKYAFEIMDTWMPGCVIYKC